MTPFISASVDLGQNLALASTAAATWATSKKASCGLIIISCPLANTLAVYIGLASTVTTSTGIELQPGDSICLPIDDPTRVYCITAYVATTQNVRVLTL